MICRLACLSVGSAWHLCRTCIKGFTRWRSICGLMWPHCVKNWRKGLWRAGLVFMRRILSQKSYNTDIEQTEAKLVNWLGRQRRIEVRVIWCLHLSAVMDICMSSSIMQIQVPRYMQVHVKQSLFKRSGWDRRARAFCGIRTMLQLHILFRFSKSEECMWVDGQVPSNSCLHYKSDM